MKDEGLENVEPKSMDWHLFGKEQFEPQTDKSVCWGQQEANMSSQPFEKR